MDGNNANTINKKNRLYKTLDDSQIETYFPIRKFSQKQKAIFDHAMCMVCLADFENGEDIRKILLCNHIFHSDCLLQWVRKEEKITNLPFLGIISWLIVGKYNF